MLNVFRKWIYQYLSDEEGLVLLLLLISSLVIILTLGHVLAPFLTALVVAYLLQGVQQWLKRRGVSPLIASILTFLLFISVLSALLLIILPAAWGQMARFFYELPSMVKKGQDLLMHLPMQYPEFINVQQVESWNKEIAKEMTSLGQHVLSFSLTGITGLMSILIYLVLVPILVFFLLKDGELLSRWVSGFLPQKRTLLKRVWQEMDLQIANYIRGKMIEIIVVGVVSYVVFLILGLNYAALLAIGVGLSVLIPYIGAAVVTIPIALVAYVQWGFDNQFIAVMIAYTIIQALDGNVLVPILFSEAVNLHPIAIILAVLVFGGLWGFWGVFFAIPLATLFKAIVNAWPKIQVEQSNEADDFAL